MPNVSRRKKIIKVKTEINERDSKNIFRRSMNPEDGSLKR